jgi:hypothetical protein
MARSLSQSVSGFLVAPAVRLLPNTIGAATVPVVRACAPIARFCTREVAALATLIAASLGPRV